MFDKIKKIEEFRENALLDKKHSIVRGIAVGVALGSAIASAQELDVIDTQDMWLMLAFVPPAMAISYKMNSNKENRVKAHSLSLEDKTKNNGYNPKLEQTRHYYNQTTQFSGTILTMMGAGMGLVAYAMTQNPEAAVELTEKFIGPNGSPEEVASVLAYTGGMGIVGHLTLKTMGKVFNLMSGRQLKKVEKFNKNCELIEKRISDHVASQFETPRNNFDKPVRPA